MGQKHRLVGYTTWEVAMPAVAGQRCEPCVRFDLPVACGRVACRAIERADKKEVIFLPDTRKGFLRGVELVLAGALLGKLP